MKNKILFIACILFIGAVCIGWESWIEDKVVNNLKVIGTFYVMNAARNCHVIRADENGNLAVEGDLNVHGSVNNYSGRLSVSNGLGVCGGSELCGNTSLYLGDTGKFKITNTTKNCSIFQVDNSGNTAISGFLWVSGMKTGTDQANAGAHTGELWADSDDGYSIKLGQ